MLNFFRTIEKYKVILLKFCVNDTLKSSNSRPNRLQRKPIERPGAGVFVQVTSRGTDSAFETEPVWRPPRLTTQ